MPDYELIQLSSAGQLRDQAVEWDSLWQRSDVTIPVARAAAVAIWSEHFCDGELHALMVYDGERAVAAMPVAPRKKRGLKLGTLATNPWYIAGDLLLDPAANAQHALTLLAEGLERLRLPLAWLDFVAYESPRWRQLLSILEARGWFVSRQQSYLNGQIELTGSWHDYEMSRSGNHRRHMRKAQRRATRAGRFELRVLDRLKPADVEPAIRQACEIEDRCWKGRAGSSVLRTPGMFELSVEIAQQLAAWEQLCVVFLDLADGTAAFELGYLAKQTYYSPKIGLDESFATFSPGQLLRNELLQSFMNEQRVQLVDFWGPLSDATAKWATRAYPMGRVVAAPPRVTSRALWLGYRALRRCRAALRKSTEAPAPKILPVGDAAEEIEAEAVC